MPSKKGSLYSSVCVIRLDQNYKEAKIKMTEEFRNFEESDLTLIYLIKLGETYKFSWCKTNHLSAE